MASKRDKYQVWLAELAQQGRIEAKLPALWAEAHCPGRSPNKARADNRILVHWQPGVPDYEEDDPDCPHLNAMAQDQGDTVVVQCLDCGAWKRYTRAELAQDRGHDGN